MLGFYSIFLLPIVRFKLLVQSPNLGTFPRGRSAPLSCPARDFADISLSSEFGRNQYYFCWER